MFLAKRFEGAAKAAGTVAITIPVILTEAVVRSSCEGARAFAAYAGNITWDDLDPGRTLAEMENSFGYRYQKLNEMFWRNMDRMSFGVEPNEYQP